MPDLPPVLLAHGFASSFELNWRQPGFVDLLQESGRTVLPFDFPGHGTGEKSRDPERYADLAADLATALPADGSQVDIVGFSMGAATTLRLATRVPERFRRIVVAGVGDNLFRENDRSMVADSLAGGEAPDDNVTAQLFVQFSKAPGNDPEALAACMRRMEIPIPREDLARVTCPVLVVLGDKDFAGPAAPLMEALPNAKLVTLRNTEHFATPRAFGFIDAALDFLAEHV